MTTRRPVEHVAVTSLRDTAMAWDGRRARSRQVKVGPSELGTCRRRLAYRLARHPRTDPSSSMKAVMGTFLHVEALRVLRQRHGGITEVRVEDELVKGSADWLRQDQYGLWIVEDLKTKGLRVYESVVTHPTAQDTLWQTMTYADKIRRGQYQRRERRVHEPLDVVEVHVKYVCRDDGREHTIVHPFDQAVADEARAWAREVIDRVDTDGVAYVPRDRNGPGLDPICDSCPFRTACWGEATGWAPQAQLVTTDEEAAALIEEYRELSDQVGPLERRRKMIRQMLDATPACTTPAGTKLAWTGGKGRDVEVRDDDATDEWLRAAGIEPPTKMVVKTSPRAIKVTAPALTAPPDPEE